MVKLKTSMDPKTRRLLFAEGRDYWYQYLSINGYSLRPNRVGLQKLSHNLDINIPRLRRAINFFIDN